MGSIAASPIEDVAIIGMACRLPGDATSTSKLWNLLMEGKSAWSEVPATRWNQDAHYHPSQEHAGSNIVKGGHFLRDGEQNGKQFDAAFFNITRTEAETMDLQQRIVSRSCKYLHSAYFLGKERYTGILSSMNRQSEAHHIKSSQWKMSMKQWRALASGLKT